MLYFHVNLRYSIVLLVLLCASCTRPTSEAVQEARQAPTVQALPVALAIGLNKSKTEQHRIKSKILGYDLQYWVHLPKGYQEGQSYPTIYVTDGFWYKNQGELLQITDRLIKKEKIEPIIAILVDAISPDNRNDNRREYQFLCNPKYVDFYRDELIPHIDKNYATDTSRVKRAMLGLSFGGLNSMYFGLMANDVFGKLGIQSPAPHPCPDIYEAYRNSPRLPIDIYLSTGTVNDKEVATRKLKGILEEKGYDFAYQEVPEGHNWANWKPLLDDVLLRFYGIEGQR